MASEDNEPLTETRYGIQWQGYYGETAGPWVATYHDYTDRGEAEAVAERFSRNHHAQWPDRRNYAVVAVIVRRVKMFLAPVRAG